MVSLNDLCATIDNEQYHIAAETLQNYDSYRTVIRRAPIAQLPLDQITDADIAQFVRSRLSDGLATSYINKLLSYLRTRLAAAQRRGFIRQAPAIKLLRHQRKDVDPFTEDELRAIFNAAGWAKHPKWMKPYARLLTLTGLRPCEAVAVTDVDVTVGMVRVNKKLNRLGRVGLVKTRHGVRDVPLAPGLASEILNYNHPWVVKGALFPMMAYRAEHWWRGLLKDAGVEYRPIYQLRHTFASRALKLGATPIEVAGWLGHSSIRHVCDVYGQWATTKNSPVFVRMSESVK
jgi:integrase